jgi:Lon-like ATP-dependent protease
VIKAIRTLLQRGQPYIGAFLLKDSNSDSDVITSPDQVYPVGVFAQITSVFGSGDVPGADAAAGKAAGASGEDGDKKETLTAVLYPHRRIRIDELLQQPPVNVEVSSETAEKKADRPKAPAKPEAEDVEQDMTGESSAKQSSKDASPAAPRSHISFLHSMVPEISLTNVSNLELEAYNKDDQTIKAHMNELLSVFKDIAQLAPIFREQITSFTINQSSSNVFDDPDKLADFAAAVSSGDVADLQGVLESLSVQDRLHKALTILKKELINAQLQSKIARDVETKLHKRQREVYLMEQLKGIKKELGMDSDGKDKLVEGFKEKASKLAMPEGVKTVFDEEINKLMHLEPAASEFK